MKPQARIQTTIEILELLKPAKIPMDLMIGDYMRSRRYIGSKDRAFVAEKLYDMTRAQGRIGWWLERMKAEDTPRNRALFHLALMEGANEKRIDDLCDGSKYSPEPLTDEEKTWLQKLAGEKFEHDDMPISVKTECPPEYAEKLQNYFGKDFEPEMNAMMQPATLDLRVNTFLIERENTQKSLEKDGVQSKPTPYSPWGLRCESKVFISKSKAFNKGWVSIQDEGSQLIAHVCGVEPGNQVLDYCAGAGGKTLALAAAMKRKGRIVAMDLDAKRLEKGRLRFKKSGLADIIEVRPLSDDRHRKWLKRQKQTFDVTLCDVPCTGTGTWRRNPDMRWNTYGPGLEELLPVQAEILDKVAHTVKPGGKLVYATCSLLPDENENQAEAFLARHPEFELSPLDASIGLGTPYMRLTPHRHNTDGFFAAIFTRKHD